MKPWYCINCNAIIELDGHGRCPVCESDAVIYAGRLQSLVSTEDLMDNDWRFYGC